MTDSWVGFIVRRRHDDSLRWRVVSRDTNTKTLMLEDWNGGRREIIYEDPEYEVVCRPTTDWPYVPNPSRPNDIIEHLQQPVGMQMNNLEPMYDWVPSDRHSSAGSIYLSPTLKLTTGDLLIATYRSGRKRRVTITRQFGSMLQKKLRLVKKVKHMDAWSRLGTLLDDD